MTPQETPQEHVRNALMLLNLPAHELEEEDLAAARARLWRAVEQLEGTANAASVA